MSTPKRRVRAKWPAAYSYRWADGFCVYRPFMQGNINMGTGRTAQEAWRDAEANMKAGKL